MSRDISGMNVRLVLERESVNQLSKENIERQLREISKAGGGKPQTLGVEGKHYDLKMGTRGDKQIYSAEIFLVKTKYRTEAAAVKCLEAAKKYVKKAAEHRHWVVQGDIGELEEMNVARAEWTPINADFEMTDERIQQEFPNIFDRNAHIRLIHQTVRDAIDCKFQERSHSLLYGLPTSAKTRVFLELKKLYEKNGDTEHVAVINSTTLTKAGLEGWILERAKMKILPEILLFDEIEKSIIHNEASLSCLLSIMDGQGQISRLNARIGREKADAKCLVWATCNNEELLRKFQDGAVWSRFGANKLPCTRPSKEIAKQIIIDRIKERQERGQPANLNWADIIVNYFFEQKGDNDLRACLDALVAGHRLETGEHFKDVDKVFAAQDSELQNLALMGI